MLVGQLGKKPEKSLIKYEQLHIYLTKYGERERRSHNQKNSVANKAPLEFEHHLEILQPNSPKQSHLMRQKMPGHGL